MSICIKDNIQNMNLVIGCTVGCSYCYARNNVKRYHMIDDFSKPEFFPNKLRLMENQEIRLDERCTYQQDRSTEFPADRHERFGGMAAGVEG